MAPILVYDAKFFQSRQKNIVYLTLLGWGSEEGTVILRCQAAVVEFYGGVEVYYASVAVLVVAEEFVVWVGD